MTSNNNQANYNQLQSPSETKQQKKQQMGSAQSPLFFIERKKLPPPSSCFVPFSGVSFLPARPVTCSQRRYTWQQQLAGSVFQWRRSQRSVYVSFSPFFDLISKQTTIVRTQTKQLLSVFEHLGMLSVPVQSLVSQCFQEMYFTNSLVRN